MVRIPGLIRRSDRCMPSASECRIVLRPILGKKKSNNTAARAIRTLVLGRKILIS
jgi:hypothetical protein